MRQNIREKINSPENHIGGRLSYLHIRDRVELIFLAVRNSNDVVWDPAKEDKHDWVSEDEEKTGVKCENNDDLFPKAELNKPGFELREAGDLLEGLLHGNGWDKNIIIIWWSPSVWRYHLSTSFMSKSRATRPTRKNYRGLCRKERVNF